MAEQDRTVFPQVVAGPDLEPFRQYLACLSPLRQFLMPGAEDVDRELPIDNDPLAFHVGAPLQAGQTCEYYSKK